MLINALFDYLLDVSSNPSEFHNFKIPRFQGLQDSEIQTNHKFEITNCELLKSPNSKFSKTRFGEHNRCNTFAVWQNNMLQNFCCWRNLINELFDYLLYVFEQSFKVPTFQSFRVARFNILRTPIFRNSDNSEVQNDQFRNDQIPEFHDFKNEVRETWYLQNYCLLKHYYVAELLLLLKNTD